MNEGDPVKVSSRVALAASWEFAPTFNFNQECPNGNRERTRTMQRAAEEMF